jgi:hypothetical protein
MTEVGFGADYEIKSSPFFRFDKVGARFVGIYRGNEERKNNLDATGKEPMQIVHKFDLVEQFDTEVNNFVKGDQVLFAKTGEGGRIINSALSKISVGSVVGVAFVEEKPPTKPGQKGAHIMRVYDLSLNEKYAQYLDRKSDVEEILENIPF